MPCTSLGFKKRRQFSLFLKSLKILFVENPQLFANRCRSIVAAELEVPPVELDYEDGNALLMAAKCGLPGHTGLINVSYFNKQFGFGREKIYEELEEYSILSQKKGKIILMQN